MPWLGADNPWLWWLVAVSVIGFFGSIIGAGVMLVLIPADYFVQPDHSWRSRTPVQWVWFVVKNALGVILLIAGILMLFLPGQGVLTILVGVMLIDFPGKRRLETKLIRRPGVLKTINGLRAKFGKAPLVFEEEKAQQ